MENFKIVAGKEYTLAQGVTANANEILIQDLTGRDGQPLTMALFGDIGYATLEPRRRNMEFISFTGITGNRLTGVVRGYKFNAPYDTDASLAKPHALGTTLIFSNSPQFYKEFAQRRNDNTITETYTFEEYPRIDDASTPPVDDEEFATKKYADDLAIAGSPDATETVKGIVELATDQEAEEGTDTGSTGATLVPRASQLLKAQESEVTTSFPYGATISVGDWVMLDGTTGKWILADATNANTVQGRIGYALDSGVDDDTGKRVQIDGVINSLSGLTPGYKYVQDTAGTIGATPGTVRKVVGRAASATQLVMMDTFNVARLTGANANATTANLNEAMDFFATTDMTGAEAETLTGGVSSYGDALHSHKNATHFVGIRTTTGSISIPANTLKTGGALYVRANNSDGGLTISFGGQSVTVSGAANSELLIVQTSAGNQTAYQWNTTSTAPSAVSTTALTVDTSTSQNLTFGNSSGTFRFGYVNLIAAPL
jgi:hypothetical protein